LTSYCQVKQLMLIDCPNFSNITVLHMLSNGIGTYVRDILEFIISYRLKFAHIMLDQSCYYRYRFCLKKHSVLTMYDKDCSSIDDYINDYTLVLKYKPNMFGGQDYMVIYPNDVNFHFETYPNDVNLNYSQTNQKPIKVLVNNGNNSLYKVLTGACFTPVILHYGNKCKLEDIKAHFESSFFKKLLYLNIVTNTSDSQLVNFLENPDFLDNIYGS